ncbi:universal stress protein [Piscinibacter gummiphilus]|uniref:Universal stress protein n=1 Tax=Piscinibacter gummiphilus TaxID=946333 RepID=A0ABZ0D7D1_9BURK|nr:universal stress protein [Piscinibacter gummiphilus]WOB10619.1 universal stress protein [Piscinibacter gummiphilus]
MYDKILVPIDGSATSTRGLNEAIDLARQLKSQLVLLTVVDDFPMTVEMASVSAFNETRAILVEHGKKVLEEGRTTVSNAGLACETVLSEVMSQRPADSIVQEAAKRACNLIVMGTHGRRGFNRMALGSDAELVLRQAPVPVLLVRSPTPRP